MSDLIYIEYLLLIIFNCELMGNTHGTNSDCFCQLYGKIDDCACNVDTIDHFNNIKIFPRLKSILRKDYFRFYKVNLKRKCPFWADDSHCAIRYCHVEACQEQDLPPGLQNQIGQRYQIFSETFISGHCEDYNMKLSWLDTTISEEMRKELELWRVYDENEENFCSQEVEDTNDSFYVDLLLNPEQYTGYKGKSAHRIWNSIYRENCFKSPNAFYKLHDECIEERMFFRIISGLHSSINIHLSAQYLLSEINLIEVEGKWGYNLKEFQRRFSLETTNGQGSNWLKNLYYLFLVELRALNKASIYLQKEQFYTGDKKNDLDTQKAIKDLLNLLQDFTYHFNEDMLFAGNIKMEKFKYEEFKMHFFNISRIMDCVGCDKCRLWGKLQIHGLGTALKILFAGKFDSHMVPLNKKKFRLQRDEIVALINSIGRLSLSIYHLEEFRQLMKLQ